MRALFYTVVARIHAFLRPAASDADFDQELELHLALAEEDKVRRGMSPEQARREARLQLGGAAQLREAARAARGLPWLETFWLDARLGLRMLRRSWGLTLVGGLAMAVTIGLGASMFTIWDTVTGTRLPLDEGDRIVAIQAFDKAAQRVHRETPLPDFRRWRETLKSVEQVSAMRPIVPAVIARAGADDSVAAAEMTASGFQLARVRPLLGRPLIEDDEREGAEPVAVIGYQLWKEGFSSDPAVLGQRIQIGDTPHIVVGVMPGGFRFPINQRLWTPLRTNPVGEVRRGSTDVAVFARLAPGATLEGAKAEVTTVGLLPHDAAAGTTAQREPRVVPYAAGMLPTVNRNSWLAGVIFLVGALLLIPPCANIAILVYARTVTRREEFAARTALGASRGRIVMQLFVEVLVLAAGAGIAGLLLARQFSGRLAGIVMPAMGPTAVLDGLRAVVGNRPLRRGFERACGRDRGCRAGVSRDWTLAASGFRRVGPSRYGPSSGENVDNTAGHAGRALAGDPAVGHGDAVGSVPADDRRARPAGRGVSDGLARHGGRLVSLRQPQDRSGETADIRGRHFRRDGVSGRTLRRTRRRDRGGRKRGAGCGGTLQLGRREVLRGLRRALSRRAQF